MPTSTIPREPLQRTARARKSMDAHPVVHLEARQPVLPQRRDADVMASPGETMGELLYDALLATDDRRVELREHQDAHAPSREISR